MAASFRAFTDEELIDFLMARPDLSDRVGSFVDLAVRSVQSVSLQKAVAGLTAFEQQVLDSLLHLGHPADAVDIASLAAKPGDSREVTVALNRLRVLGLVRRTNSLFDSPGKSGSSAQPGSSRETGALFEPVKELRRVVPNPFILHASLEKLLDRYSVPDLRTMAINVGLPERTIGKVGLIADLVEQIGSPDGLSRILERGSFDAETLLRSIDDDLYGMLPLDTRPWTRSTIPERVGWLLSHGLLLPMSTDTVVIAREVAVLLRGGAPMATFTPHPPAVVRLELTTDPHRPSTLMELTPTALLEAVAAIGTTWARNPPVPLRTDGVGVKDVRNLSKILGVDERTVSRLIELAGLAGLVSADSFSNRIGPTAAFHSWLSDDPLSRWSLLVHTWANASTSLSRVVRRDELERFEAPLSPTWDVSVDYIWRRVRVVEALGSISGDEPIELMSVAQRARWFSPLRWGHALDYLDAVLEVCEEAALLGAYAGGTLTPLARALWLEPDPDALELAAKGTFKPPVSVFTVSGDLSAIAPGELASSVAVELGLLAELVSKGGAAVYRFTDASIRGALDHGRTVEEIHAFLESHAKPGVPQPLAYLIDDVARRYGSARVGSALAYIRVDDPVLMAELTRAKKVAKLKLRQLAPTVAVSEFPAAKLMKGLRDAGFLPVEEGNDGVVIRNEYQAAPTPHRTQNGRKSFASVSIWKTIHPVHHVPATMQLTDKTLLSLIHTLRAKG